MTTPIDANIKRYIEETITDMLFGIDTIRIQQYIKWLVRGLVEQRMMLVHERITSYPESTEGRPLGQPLKKLEGAPLNLGYWFWNRNPPGNKEHPIDAATEQTRPYPHPL